MKATVSGAHEDGDVGSREHRLEQFTWRHAVEIKGESHTHAIERWVGAFRVHPSRKMENLTWMLSSGTKKLLGGPTRHEAHRAAASSLLCHGCNCCQLHEASTLTKRNNCWHKDDPDISKTTVNNENK